jgi:hypothetical protein
MIFTAPVIIPINKATEIKTAMILGNRNLYSRNDAIGYKRYENNTDIASGYNIDLASLKA